jgi:DNA-binding NarL/FixJ family response regulator
VKRPRVILADDHRIVAEGLRGLLAPEFDVVAVVEDGRALLEAARSLQPEVVVADIGMPHLNGIEVTTHLARELPEIKVVILTMHREEAYARRALEAGASGYVLKVAAPGELIFAIRAALAGKTFVTPELASELLGNPAGSHSRDPNDAAAILTPRQREILQLIAAGKTAKEIGTLLRISTRTVESHKYEIMRAVGVRTSAELVHFAIRNGIVPL